MIEDVPSPIDLRLMDHALEWEATASTKRPSRIEFFALFASTIAAARPPVSRVLELGSGPGFLAEHLLRSLPSISHVALDFSPAMHQLAVARLGSFGARVQFIERSFREPGWSEGLGRFDCVVTHQAVHELRHKRHASALHAQVRQLLQPGGTYLVCDHFAGEGGMSNNQLFMSIEEQRDALLHAGFGVAAKLLTKGSLVLHQAS